MARRPALLFIRLDDLRGDKSRSTWVADKIKKARAKTSLPNKLLTRPCQGTNP